MELLDFDDLRLAYKPYLRPPGLAERIRGAYGIDAHFIQEFRALRHLMHARQATLADDLLRVITGHQGIDARFSAGDMQLFRRLVVPHLRSIHAGRFDDGYLDTVEDMALLLARHDCDPFWIEVAYHDFGLTFLDQILRARSMTDPQRRRSAYRCLHGWMLIETGQIRRVFGEYARLRRQEARSPLAPALPDIPPEPPPEEPGFRERLARLKAPLLRR